MGCTLTVIVLALLTLLCGAPPVSVTRDCGDQKFYQKYTDSCEPCGVLCDPPGVYETECPKRCPRYTPTSTTTRPPDSGIPTPDSGLSTTYKRVIIAVSIVVGVILIALLACAIGKFNARLRKQMAQWFGSRKLSIEEEHPMAPSALNVNLDAPKIGHTVPSNEENAESNDNLIQCDNQS